VTTFITLLLVPVFYAIFVLDLKWIDLGGGAFVRKTKGSEKQIPFPLANINS
jgi:hypothetical protein